MDEIELLYEKYYRNVKKYALTLCCDDSLAEEITQETFYKALKSVDKFRGECSVEIWLCKIAKNTFFSMKKKKTCENIEDYYTLALDSNFENDVDEKESVAEILKLIKELKSPYKDVFYMRALAELPFSVIGGVWDKSESWARLIYFRAKKQIAERMNTDNE